MKKTSIQELILLFAIPSIAMFIAIKLLIPLLHSYTLFPIEISFFLSTGIFVFIPLLITALIMIKKEMGELNLKSVLLRLRIKTMKSIDWIYTIGSFLIVTALSTLLTTIGTKLLSINTTLPFMDNMPLHSGAYWILIAWFPFFICNIFGEELWWRGYIQPRQELLNKKHTWLVHGILWAFFHISLGWSLLFLSIPMFLIVPLVVQLRKNTTISIILHALFGLLGILSRAFNLA